MGKYAEAINYLCNQVPGVVYLYDAYNTFSKRWNNTKNIRTIPLSKTSFEWKERSRTYCWIKWEEESTNDKGTDPTPNTDEVVEMINIQTDLNRINWENFNEHETVLLFNKESGEFIAAKVARRSCLSSLSGRRGSGFNRMRVFFKLAFDSKPDIPRGSEKSGVGLFYKCFGWRLAYSAGVSWLEEYVFKKNVDAETMKTINTFISMIVQQAEEIAKQALNGLGNFDYFKHVKKFINLPSLGSSLNDNGEDNGICTQMAMASGGYWSSCHLDDDFFFTILSVLASEKKRDHLPCYYFNFPTFGVSIPMSSGDVLVFNSKIPHCTSNPRNPNDYIYSMYVAEKSVNCNAWLKFKKDNPEKAAEIEKKLDEQKRKQKKRKYR